MIHLLLVDDEESTREGLAEFIPWSKIGIHRLDIAKNGKEAMELVRSISPDILLTDIRMPNMDGIELASRVRQLLPECKIIFISGFADKEYLKSAIRLNAVGYIEKPLNIKEITDLLTQTAELCEVEKQKKNHEVDVNKRIEEGIPLLKQRIGAQLASEKAGDENILQELEAIGFNTSFPWKYTTFAIRFKFKDHADSGPMNILPEKLLGDLLASDQLTPVFSGFNNGGTLLLHAALESHSASGVQSLAERMKEYLRQVCGNHVLISIGIGRTVPALKELHISFRTALEAIRRIFFHGYGTIIPYHEAEPTAPDNDIFPGEGFIAALREGSKDKAIAAVKNVTFNLRGEWKAEKVRACFLKLFIALEAEADKRGISRSLFSEQGNEEEILMNLETVHDLSDFLLKRIEMFFEAMERKIQMGGPLYEVTRYIEEHYGDSGLSVKSIAVYANYSHFYLCNLFKKNMGITINEYITRMRMDKAKELLKDKKMKMYEVSKKVGYGNLNYFIKLFKKYEGCTPAEFKEKYYV